MVRIVGVESVICTCGKEMKRTGGTLGWECDSSTYYCKHCKKVVNVIVLPEDKTNEFIEGYNEKYRGN